MNDLKFDYFYLYIGKLEKALKDKKVNFNFRSGMLGRRLKPWIKNKVLEFYGRYKCHHFSEMDFQTYFLECLIEDENFLESVLKWDVNNVKEYKDSDVQKTIEMDYKFLSAVSKQAKVKNVQVLFDINSSGDSLVYKFYKENKLSLHFLVKCIPYFKESDKEHGEHKRFIKILKIMNEIQKINKIYNTESTKNG